MNNSLFTEFTKKGFVKIKLDKKYMHSYKTLKNNIRKNFPKNFKKNKFENLHDETFNILSKLSLKLEFLSDKIIFLS